MPHQASCCLYLTSNNQVSLRNIRYLSNWLNTKPQPVFEVIVCYTANLDIAKMSKLYPNIRWYRLQKKPVNRFFLFVELSKKIRSKIFIFISPHILIMQNDLIALANNALKKDVIFSYLENPRPVFLKVYKNHFFNRFGYYLNEARSQIYASLNRPFKISSIEMFSLHVDHFAHALKKITLKEKIQFFRERFAVNRYYPNKDQAYFDFIFPYIAARTNMKIDSPGRAQGRWQIPTHAGFFPLFLFFKQIFLLTKLIISNGCRNRQVSVCGAPAGAPQTSKATRSRTYFVSDRYVLKIINYQRILLFVSYLALISFFLLSYQGYHSTWFLLVFFFSVNLPLLWYSCRPLLRLRNFSKVFLILF